MMFVLLCFVFYPDARANQIADFRVLVPLIGLVFQLLICANALGNLSISDLWRSIWRPLFAIGSTTAALHAIPTLGFALPAVLLVKCCACAVGYIGSVALLWKMAGMPDGAESYLWNNAKSFIQARRERR
jgi:hypothetical protein